MKPEKKEKLKGQTNIKRQNLRALGFLLLGILLLILGLVAGEYRMVWQKAVTICLDCLGLG